MAILINKDVRLNEDLITPQLYVRFAYKMKDEGNSINVGLKYYTSKNSYLSKNKYRVHLMGLPDFLVFPYNRETDGVDVLEIIHTEAAKYLSSDLMEDGVKMKDPSTGRYLLDETGKIVIGSKVVIEKFCDMEDIEFVDMGIEIDPEEVLNALDASISEEIIINNIEDGSIN